MTTDTLTAEPLQWQEFPDGSMRAQTALLEYHIQPTEHGTWQWCPYIGDPSGNALVDAETLEDAQEQCILHLEIGGMQIFSEL